MRDWTDYYELETNTFPSLVVAQGLLLHTGQRITALDLGTGTGRDSRYLLEKGFEKIVAVDASSQVLAYVQRSSNLEVLIQPIQSYIPIPGSFDFCNCANTLWFLEPLQVAVVVSIAHMALRKGGTFACNLMGKKDDWHLRGKEVSVFDATDALYLFYGWEILRRHEFELDEPAAGTSVPKHWHLHSYVLRK